MRGNEAMTPTLISGSPVRVREGAPESPIGARVRPGGRANPRRRGTRVPTTWPVGQAVKTAASHAANMGSIPVRVTIFLLTKRGEACTI